MKIDIHVHTKKTKAGDSEHRSVDKDRFCEIVKSTNVRIIAITNHNHFDFDQYNEFRAGMADTCHIWPGIELDVLESGRRAHLIVIVNPKNADEFSKRVNKLLENKTADNFTITLKETSDNFKDLDSIYIAHYHTKKPNLHDEDVNSLLELVPDKRRVLKEATNSISAGIYISHGHNSIYGSDIHDWNEYINVASSLPDLRLPVESYEQFCLLLEKDSATINTILNKKSKDSLQINPFSAAELINIDIYNDINIIFGSKGTGKTEILKSLSKYYNSIGHKTNVYESNSQHLKEVYNLKGADLVVNVGDHGLEDCAEEFRAIREATEKNITSISSYVRHFSTQETNKISQKIKVKDFVKLDESVSERRFDEIKDILEEFNGFSEYLDANENLSEIIGAELLEELTDTLTKILQKLKESSETRLLDARSIAMFNSLIKVLLAEISKKTGQPEKPIKTGFHEYASNRILIVFKKNEFQPQTYLNQLRAFGERTYPRSDIFPDHPSIIVELAHLRFDLVPAYVETDFFGDETIYIPGPPSKDLKWIETDPTSFKKQLGEKNNDKNGLTISIIKIMKYWNCINNYPFSSFFLERVAVKNNVSGKNLKECFYDFISEISDYNLTDFQAKVFNPLKENKRKLKILEEQNIPNYIQQELASFIPIPA